MSDPVTRLRLRVSPGAPRSSVVGRYADGWKVRVGALPVDGRANAKLEAYLSEVLEVDRGQLRIVAGAGGRDKVVEIRGCEPLRAEALLAAAAGEREETA